MDTTHSTKIRGIEFQMPVRYAEGHPLTAVEAGVLNQTLAENLGNNFSKEIEKARKAWAETQGREWADTDVLPQDIIDSLREKFTTYAAEYTFTVRAPKIQLDPLDKLMRKIAKELVDSALRAKNIDKKTLKEETYEGFISTLVAQNPAVREEAIRRLDAQRNLGNMSISGLLPATDGAEVSA